MVQMPAVNTPQFSWVLSRLPHHAEPVPPIYEPELTADAVLYAADHPKRREYWVGVSTALTLAGNAIAPGPLDRYLARTAVKASKRPSHGIRPRRSTSGNRQTGRTARTTVRTASSTPAPTTPTHNSGPPSTTACWPVSPQP